MIQKELQKAKDLLWDTMMELNYAKTILEEQPRLTEAQRIRFDNVISLYEKAAQTYYRAAELCNRELGTTDKTIGKVK